MKEVEEKPKRKVIGPCSEKQRLVLTENSVDILLTGGGAGGGKTMTALMKALSYVSDKYARVLILRKTMPLLRAPGGILDEAKELYSDFGAKLNKTTSEFTFPSGGQIKLTSIPQDIQLVKGWQPTHVIFDEATEATLDEILMVQGRIRSAKYKGKKMCMILTCNPDRLNWLYDWVEYCLDDNGVPLPGTEHRTRYFINLDGYIYWADTIEELYSKHWFGSGRDNKDFKPLSFKFIPMTIEDNPILQRANPEYKAKLLGQSRVNQLRFLHGSWTAVVEGSSMVKEDMFEIVDNPPTNPVQKCRGWDFAAGVPNEANGFKCDWTVGVLMSLDRTGTYYIEDVVRFQKQVGGVIESLVDIGQLDGDDVYQIFPNEPGQAGKGAAKYYANVLASNGVSSRQDASAHNKSKKTRFSPFASVAPHKSVKLVKGDWNKLWISEVCSFKPDIKNQLDDQVDATSTAFNYLARSLSIPTISIGNYSKSSPIPSIN